MSRPPVFGPPQSGDHHSERFYQLAFSVRTSYIFNMTLGEYLKLYPPHPPLRSSMNEDENRKLGPAEGVRFLQPPPPLATERRVPGRSSDPGCHLWVIDQTGIPYLLELAPVGRRSSPDASSTPILPVVDRLPLVVRCGSIRRTKNLFMLMDVQVDMDLEPHINSITPWS